MAERVLIYGASGEELVSLFEERGFVTAHILRPPAESDLPELRALILAPGDAEAETLATQLATLRPLTAKAGCLLGVLLPPSWARYATSSGDHSAGELAITLGIGWPPGPAVSASGSSAST